MSTAAQAFQKLATRREPESLAQLRPGVTVRVHQKIKEGDKSRIQIFEGLIIARKHGAGPDATITVRKVSSGIGVERVFPLHLTTIDRFEIVRAARVRRAKLYYIRTKSARETRRKTKAIDLPTTSSSTEAASSSEVVSP